jgi:hypothetical protein
MTSLPNTTSAINRHTRLIVHRTPVDEARRYLGALEAVAHAGRTAKDAHEVMAAVKMFAEPSAVLLRLAERSRKADRN